MPSFLLSHSLVDRTFKTIDFYRKHQDDMTPAGLAFFQSQWDESVTNTFHNTLNMKEPVFEFIRPPVYHPPQVKYPHRQPLRYLDSNQRRHCVAVLLDSACCSSVTTGLPSAFLPHSVVSLWVCRKLPPSSSPSCRSSPSLRRALTALDPGLAADTPNAPESMSSSRDRAVSKLLFIVVAITPVGPVFSQPLQYNPKEKGRVVENVEGFETCGLVNPAHRVWHDGSAGVERHGGIDGEALVADAADDKTAGNVFHLSGQNGPSCVS
ncbi:hypothetical protein CCH79_00003474 [Gambusia affinis]|uniref:Uncharacterized protein n=1 Tax=Gambusia affinis TaxID=33528 RepID=A0A315VDR8_GAMAF|nr:hypothetical protein CCH79_00003474 [Gambusia affinis]